MYQRLQECLLRRGLELTVECASYVQYAHFNEAESVDFSFRITESGGAKCHFTVGRCRG